MNAEFMMGILTSMGGYFGLMIVLSIFVRKVRSLRKR